MNTTIEELERQLYIAKKVEREKNRNKKFLCVCGSKHRIRDCKIIHTYWYADSHSDWSKGELKIICPETYIRNRVMFEVRPEIEKGKRWAYSYNPLLQFSKEYKGLFNEVINDYGKEDGAYENNYYFDRNQDEFNIKIGEEFQY